MNTCPATHHGTTYAYRRYGCRCPGVHRRWKTKQVPGTGRHGYAFNGYDPVNVTTALQRARRGDPPALISVPERRAVVAALTAEHWSANRIAAALGLAQRSVLRHRAAVRERQAA